jgi:uncharacterized protein YecE (DUF72 family)
VGCSGWAYPSWRPDFYPAKTPQKKLLEAYAARLNSVEVNYTFRSLPSAAIVEGWLRATSDAFRFSFKAPQGITHFARLRNAGSLLEAFARSLQPVVAAGRFGLVLFQLPPNFAANPELLGEFLPTAKEAFAPGSLRLAFEFRHASWFSDATYAVLRQHGAAICVAESDELETPDVVTAPYSCYRLRRSDYSPAELDAVGSNLEQHAQHGEVFAYFKHEDEPSGPLRAAAVLEALCA